MVCEGRDSLLQLGSCWFCFCCQFGVYSSQPFVIQNAASASRPLDEDGGEGGVGGRVVVGVGLVLVLVDVGGRTSGVSVNT